MTDRRRISLVMFLALVPVTLLVPGLHELVVARYGGSQGDAHAFMTANMLAGVGGVPLVMRLLQRFPDVRRWLLASALMFGVTVGSPLGGWLIEHGSLWVYAGGALFFVAAAAVAAGLTDVPDVPRALGQRYIWNRRAPETWVPLGYAFMDRFSIGIFASTFTLFLFVLAAVSYLVLRRVASEMSRPGELLAESAYMTYATRIVN